MSFDELYESCFRDAPLVKILGPNKTKEDPVSTNLDHLFNASQYVAFFLTESCSSTAVAPRTLELAEKLEQLARNKNAAGESKEKASRSPARIRRFFGMKKKKKTKSPSEAQIMLSVVVVETDNNKSDENGVLAGLPGWYSLQTQDEMTKPRLLRALGFEVAPSVMIVDTGSRSVVTTEARRLLHEDPTGEQFPWWPPNPHDILDKMDVLRRDGEKTTTVPYKGLPKVRALFFGAYWCPPCRQWVKHLQPAYEALKAHKIDIEIIFCSSDRSQESLFNVAGIPTLILIDEENRIITRHGRETILGDPKGEHFPWGTRPLYELTELNLSRLKDEPTLILFTEGSPEDVQFSFSVLYKVSRKLHMERIELEKRREVEKKEKGDENGNGSSRSSTPQLRHSTSQEECSSVDSDVVPPPHADPLQIFYTGEDPICDFVLEQSLGLADAELPLICIIDSIAGRYSVCPDPDVSEEVLSKFVDDYRAHKLNWTKVAAGKICRTVGGIPVQEIEKALMGNSPSQNSISNTQENVQPPR
ncbi:unnamed protein product, partial [Mesorhabditis spiculigera]